ncbi:hypothetical protein D9M73_237880 [compost metagenome]
MRAADFALAGDEAGGVIAGFQDDLVVLERVADTRGGIGGGCGDTDRHVGGDHEAGSECTARARQQRGDTQ